MSGDNAVAQGMFGLELSAGIVTLSLNSSESFSMASSRIRRGSGDFSRHEVLKNSMLLCCCDSGTLGLIKFAVVDGCVGLYCLDVPISSTCLPRSRCRLSGLFASCAEGGGGTSILFLPIRPSASCAEGGGGGTSMLFLCIGPSSCPCAACAGKIGS